MPGSNSRPNVSEGDEVPTWYELPGRPAFARGNFLFFFLSSFFAPGNLVSRDKFDHPVPRQAESREFEKQKQQILIVCREGLDTFRSLLELLYNLYYYID